MVTRKYYEAYDERYKTVHDQGIQWFGPKPSPIVDQMLAKYKIQPGMKLLELGCGEGRDASWLLANGHDLLATDISEEAIRYCRNLLPQYAHRFSVLDCVSGHLKGGFDFIYAVAVVHMLLLDQDRDGFYRFIRDHLSSNGIGLICSMGDGQTSVQSDINDAFRLQERAHGGQTLLVAGTSCRMVTNQVFFAGNRKKRSYRFGSRPDLHPRRIPGNDVCSGSQRINRHRIGASPPENPLIYIKRNIF